MPQAQSSYEHYRCASVGVALADTLDDMISSGRIEPQLGMRVLQHFDESIAMVLREKVTARVSIKGHLHIYQKIDDVWKLVVTDAHIKMENNQQLDVEKVKIVTCPAKDTPAG